MHDLTAKRTLVKSPPELWSELSEVDRLARHLDAFGEIKITKLEPEHTVAWEGDGASGTVSIEPSGWGTKVTLTAQLEGETAVEAEEAPVIEEPAAEAETEADVLWAEPEDEAWAEQSQIAESDAEESEAEAPEAEAPEATEAEIEEPMAVSSVEPVERAEPMEPAEPVESLPKRKRGFLAWLFRPRTSAEGTEAEPAAAAPEPAAAALEPAAAALEPAAEAPMGEEPEPGIAGGPPEADMAETEAPASEPESPAPEPEADILESEAPAPEPEASKAEPDTLAAELAAVQNEPEPVSSEPDAVGTEPEVAGGRSSLDPDRVRAVLDEVLDTLGSAHHRPFSRG